MLSKELQARLNGIDGRSTSVWPAALMALLLLSATRQSQAASFDPSQYLVGSGYTARQDSLVTYTADSLAMDVHSRRTHLRGSSRLSFLGMNLESPEILVDWENDRVEAWTPEEVPETDCGGMLTIGSGQKLLNTREVERQRPAAAGPKPRLQELMATQQQDSLADADDGELPWPVFSDGTQTLYGRSMSLNIKTRQGYIRDGRAAEDPSIYGGSRIKRVASREMHVAEAVFTTCDESCPHYHFEARQLKMLLKDKVFARDVTLHFGLVPTLYSPVALFSLKRGRSSGIILPSYGQTQSQGRKLDHLGYYWAAARTWDTQVRMSYAELGPDWLFENTTRYKWTTKDRGQFSSSYSITETQAREGWDMRWSHDQEITPYLSLHSKVALASGKQYYTDNSDNQDMRLVQNLSSNISLSGLMPEQKVRWTLNGSANQNLETGYTAGSLPVLDLSYPTWTPLQFLGRASGAAPATGIARTGSGVRDWLSSATLKLSSRAESHYDSMESLDLWTARSRRGARHAANLSFPGKLGVLALTPSIAATSVWVDETTELVRTADGGLDTVKTSGFATRQTFSSSLSASTQLYGISYPRLGRLEALRHVVSPSVAMTWTPDFSKESWGYVTERSLPNGDMARLDRFRNSIYGGTPTRESLRMSMSLGQLWQSKWSAPQTKAKPDSVARFIPSIDGEAVDPALPANRPGPPAQVLKTDLLRLTTTSSYDFIADSLKLGDFTSSLTLDPLQAAGVRLGPLRNLSLRLGTTHSPYQFSRDLNRRIARYRWQDGPDGGKPPRLTQTNITASTRFSGGGATPVEIAPDPEEEDLNRFAPSFKTPTPGIPWSLNATWAWRQDRANPTRPSRASHIDLSGSLSLSRNWRVSSGLHYDLVAKSFSSQSINVYRDMHCWEGFFTWNPRLGSYHLLIKVKSDMLDDLKWDKRNGRQRATATF